MAQNFASLTRHIIGSSYGIGRKVIIDNNCNINIPNADITARDALFNDSVLVCGDMLTNAIKPKSGTVVTVEGVEFNGANIEAGTVTANIVLSPDDIDSEILKINYLCEKTSGSTITIVNDVDLDGNLVVDDSFYLCVPTIQTVNIGSKNINKTNISAENVNVSGNVEINITGNLSSDIIQLNGIKSLGNIFTIHHPDTIVNGDMKVTGNLTVDDSFCSNTIQTDCLDVKDEQHAAIHFSSDVDVCANVRISQKLFVDQIMEFHPMAGVCIGPGDGTQIAGTTLPLPNQMVVDASVRGDTIWQSFDILLPAQLLAVKLCIPRVPGFYNTPMTARIYGGVDTVGPLVAEVTVMSYNGGDIDFSSENAFLNPGSYTLQLDFPPNNLSNYIWTGHERLPGEPVGSASNITLHVTVCTLTKGGLKVTNKHTCISNTLKLEFPDPTNISSGNCELKFTGVNLEPEVGLFGAGQMEFTLKCGDEANAQPKVISFDGNVDESGALIYDGNVLIVNDLCVDRLFANALVANVVTSEKFIGNIQGNLCAPQTIVNGNLTIEQTLLPNPSAKCVFIGQEDIGNGGLFVVTAADNGTTFCLKENVSITLGSIAIQINNAECITIDLNGHSIIGQNNETGILLNGDTNTITIKNGIFKNLFGGAIAVGSSHRNTIIENVTFADTFFDVNFDAMPGPSENICIKNCKNLMSSDASGLFFNSTDNVIVDSCHFIKTEIGFLDANTNTIIDTTFENIQPLFSFNFSTLSFQQCNNINLQKIDILGGFAGITLLNGENLTISDINLLSCDFEGIYMCDVNYVCLKNVCVVDNQECGISVFNCRNVEICKAICKNIQGSGFEILKNGDFIDNIVLRDCIAQNNANSGFKIEIITNAPIETQTVGVIENCTSIENGADGFFFDFTPTVPPDINTTFVSWKLKRCCALSNSGDGFRHDTGGAVGMPGPYIDNVLVSNASLNNGGLDYFSGINIIPSGFAQPVAPIAGISSTTTNYWTNLDTI